jgi:hypothetical protein
MLSFVKHKLSFLFFFIIIFACKQPENLTDYTGQSGEIVLVKGANVTTHFVKQVKLLLEKEISYLPQSEKSFTVFTVPENKLSGIYKKHRNIFYLKNGTQPNKLYVNKDVWAKNQIVYTYHTDNSKQSLIELEQQIDPIIDEINAKEIERLQLNYSKNSPAKKLLKNKYGITIYIPQQYSIAKQTDELFWLRKETKQTSFGVIGYYDAIPRDTLLKYNILGPASGSYMKTTNLKDSTNTITRGLWELENDFMGGSFVESKVKIAGKTIHIFGYLYAPDKPKRELLRELEAIVRSAS